MKISQLNYFITIAQLENMSRAAELLHISQSSLSKNIAALETELGTPLFDRNCKQLSLNAAGKRFLKSCNRILHEYQNLRNDIQLMTTGSDTRIKIGCCGSVDKLYPCMAAFKSEHPETEYNLNGYIEDVEYLDINEYDILIYPSELQYDKFTGFDFSLDHYQLAVPASHPLAKATAISLKMLNDLDFVFLRHKKSYPEHSYKIYKALAIQGASLSFVDSREMHRQMISAGIAVGFVSENCSDFYMSKNIRLVPLLDHRFSRELKLCFKRDKHLTDFGRCFRDFAVNYFSLTEPFSKAEKGGKQNDRDSL